MLGLRLADRKLQYIIIVSLIALGILSGAFIGLHGIYKPLIALSVGVPFLIITINRPWIAVVVFFLLIPLDSLYVFESGYNATATKFVGAYLVFLILLTGKLKYISEVFKNKKVFWIIGFVLAAVISTVFSQISSIISMNLVRLLIYLVLYFALVLMIRDIKTLSYCIYALIAGGAISILSPLLFGIGTVTFERYGGLWGDQNGFAAILITIIPLSLVLYLNESKRLMKIIAGAGFVIMLTGFFLTYSRGGFIAFLVLSILTILKMLKSKHRLKISLVVIPVLIVLFSVFYITIADDYISRVDTLRTLGNRDSSGIDGAIKNRYAYYFEVAPKLFIENPIFGVGIGGFSKYNPIREQNAHNTYLEILIGMGMVGFIPFIMILFLSWKELRAVQNTSKRIKALSVLNSYSTALELGFLSLLVAGLFISLDFSKILWLAVTLTTVMANIRRNYIISERP